MIRDFLKSPNKRCIARFDRFSLWECLRDKNGNVVYVVALPDNTGIMFTASELEKLAAIVETANLRSKCDINEWQTEQEQRKANSTWGVI